MQSTSLSRAYSALLVLAVLAGASRSAAQDETGPIVAITPGSSTVTTPTLTISIDWCDTESGPSFYTNSRYISLNGASVTGSFDFVASARSGCLAHATSTGTVTLAFGSNQFSAEIGDKYANTGSASATFTLASTGGVIVTPDNLGATLPPNRDSTQQFAIENTGNATATFTLSVSCTGAALTTQCNVAPTSLALGAGQSGNATMSYRSGAVGGTSGRVVAIAQSGGVKDSGSVHVKVPAEYAVKVSPRGTAKVVAASSSASQVFAVSNTGNLSTNYSFTTSCSGPLVTTGSCVVTPSSAEIAPGSSANVSVAFQTAASGDGAVALRAIHSASPPLARDSGWVSVSLTAPLATVALARAFPGTTLEKSACLHFGLRPGIGAECGVLRVTHALPAVRTLNKARVPTLVYYYDQAHIAQVVGFNVGRLATAAQPESVSTALYDRNTNGTYTLREQRKYSGSLWADTVVQRVALTYGSWTGTSRIANYRVQVNFKYPGQNWVAAAPPADGELVSMRREMGAGWHVAGVEILYPGQQNGAVLWIGGDGSTRKYNLEGTVGPNRVFTADAVDRPDTLLQATSDNTYTRRAGNGLRVLFDATGLHRQTINRLGHTTTFDYVTGTRRLRTITVPPASAGLVYTFEYATDGTLASVSAPGTERPRITTITPAATAGVFLRITDPDSSDVEFEYHTGWGGGTLMKAFTDRRGTRTTLDQEGYSPTLLNARTIAGMQEVAHWFRTAGSIGADPTSLPTPLDSVYLRYNGPRTDVTDITKIWLGAFDVPTKIVDPLGKTTTISYGDARFPLLATRVVRPRGLITGAGYDARGNVIADTVYNPLGNGLNAVTRFAWDTIWDAVTRVVSPTGIVTEMSYDPTTGNRLSQQTGGAAHRVTFGYDTSDVAPGLVKWTRLPTGEQDEYRYDQTRGNLRMTRSPLGFIAMVLTDAIGRDTLTIQQVSAATGDSDSAAVMAKGQRVRVRYDVANRIREQWSENGPSVTPAETLHVRTEYDSGGLVLAVRRRSIPDSNLIDWVSDSWSYDAFGRDTLAPRLRKRYNAAGHVVWTSRGDSSVYDARGLLTKRLLPAVHWLRSSSPWYMAEPDSAAADVETFDYGDEGELLKADNRYARIRRGYYPNGALRGDTSLVQGYSLGGDYGIDTPIHYEYDLDGRRTGLRHRLLSGGSAAPPPDSVRYAYDAATGALQSVTDPQDSVFVYSEDSSGRLRTLSFPGGVTENYRYDADSRLRVINSDSLLRDARGKIVWKSSGTTASTFAMTYSPLGNLVTYNRGAGVEEYRPDALGNSRTVVISGTNGGINGPVTDGDWRHYYDQGRGSIAGSTKYREEEPYQGQWMPDGDYSYNAGKQVQAKSFSYMMREMYSGGMNSLQPVVDTTTTHSSYDANDRLRHIIGVAVTHYWNGDSVRITTNEYRYDALGRRIMSRYRGPWECRYTNSSLCRSTLDRQIWDGSLLVGETRAVESGLPPDYPNFDGLVVYTHGSRLDVPLSVVRRSASSPCAFSISPHADWRGRLAWGSYNGVKPDCANVEWPGNDMSAYRQGPASDETRPWNGSLIDLGGDQSGLQYMRNRYYNPASGQFTQADLIGIAGGLNVYLYANGDPVAFSDPFGLIAQDIDIPTSWDELKEQVKDVAKHIKKNWYRLLGPEDPTQHRPPQPEDIEPESHEERPALAPQPGAAGPDGKRRLPGKDGQPGPEVKMGLEAIPALISLYVTLSASEALRQIDMTTIRIPTAPPLRPEYFPVPAPIRVPTPLRE